MPEIPAAFWWVGVLFSVGSSCFTIVIIPAGIAVWAYVTKVHLPGKKQMESENRKRKAAQEDTVLETMREIMREAITERAHEMDDLTKQLTRNNAETANMVQAVRTLAGVISEKEDK